MTTLWILLLKAAVRLHGPRGRFQTMRYLRTDLTPRQCRLLIREMRLLDLGVNVPPEGSPTRCHERSIEYAETHPRATLWAGFALGAADDSGDRCWRLHSWVVESGAILEMTGLRRRAYVGMPVDTPEKARVLYGVRR